MSKKDKKNKIKEAYKKGFNDGIEIDWDWVQCAIFRLINEEKLPENTRDLIYNEVETITPSEFNEWYDMAYPNEKTNKESKKNQE